MNEKLILYEKRSFDEGAVSVITLNRPDKLNAIDMRMADEFNTVLTEAEVDDEVKAVVIKGAGKCFSTGYDLGRVFHVYEESQPKTDNRRPSERSRLKYDRRRSEDLRRLLLFPKVTIAQVHGHCIGGGFYMTNCCDFAIAAEDAKLGHPEQRLGFAGVTYALPLEIMMIGLRRARHLLYSGKLINGKEAELIGLVTKAVPEDALDDETMRFAQAMTLIPRDGIAIGKAITHLTYESLGLTRAFAIGYIGHTLGTNLRLEPGEFNFLKTRQEKGVTAAFRERDARYEGLV
ncbi:MAG: enoyl-CoA hydratase/isomerase family protein [Chloroflexi bacterium]|nr:enoyl-CoA hydratase/isomerase family protein [Chloroflexota bacterium]